MTRTPFLATTAILLGACGSGPTKPEAIAPPATPVIEEAEEGTAVSPPTVEVYEDLPVPQQPSPEGDLSEKPTFTPYTVAPEILNRATVTQALEREYPTELREAGIGGTVNVWVFIDENGRIQAARIQRSSGHPELDEAALRVVRVMRFSPALNRGEKVPVWVAFPVSFLTL